METGQKSSGSKKRSKCKPRKPSPVIPVNETSLVTTGGKANVTSGLSATPEKPDLCKSILPDEVKLTASGVNTPGHTNAAAASAAAVVVNETKKDTRSEDVACARSQDTDTVNLKKSNSKTEIKVDGELSKETKTLNVNSTEVVSKQSKKAEKAKTGQPLDNTTVCTQKKNDKEQSVNGPPVEGIAGVVEKSKADLRRERRAIQEAQRAAKAGNQKQTGAVDGAGAKPPSQQQKQQQQKPQQQRVMESDAAAAQTKKVQGQSQTPKKPETSTVAAKDAKLRVPDNMQLDDEKTVNRIVKKLEKKQIPTRPQQQKKVSLFKHLQQYEHDTPLTSEVLINSGPIHPAILKLGLQYAHGVISGSSARCIALLKVLKEVIDDYHTPENKDLSRDLDAQLSLLISFLNQCRLQSVSMGNAIKFIKRHINKIPSDCPDKEAKENLKKVIDEFYRERILLAARAISDLAKNTVENEDVILVYACSSLVRKALLAAHSDGKRFSVIVVDGRPKFEGVTMVNYLHGLGIKCSYVQINSLSHVMPKVTKVFLGAHAILANGYLMSRIGTAQICLIAKVFDVQVFVCCETYKFCDRVQPDSFVFNELGDPNDLTKVGGKTGDLAEWRSTPSLYLLNLLYDVTPPELISLVLTDVGITQPTCVPMVLRVKNPEAY